MPQESKIRFTANNQPTIVIAGMEEIIERDLNKHKSLLEQSKLTLLSFREARSHQIKKKRHYNSLLGGEKYDDEALQKSIKMIAVDIRAMSDDVQTAERSIEHHTLIVDTLTAQLDDQNESLKALAKYRRENPDAVSN